MSPLVGPEDFVAPTEENEFPVFWVRWAGEICLLPTGKAPRESTFHVLRCC